LDIHSLHVEHVVLLGLYTLLTAVNSWMYRGMKGIHWFTLYNVCALLGALAVSLRGHIPDFVSIVLANILVMTGYLLLFLSLGDLFGRKKTFFYGQLALLAVGVAAMIQYGAIHPNTPRRLIVYSVVLGCQQAMIAVFVYRKDDGTHRGAGLPMAVMLGSLALTNLVRFMGVVATGAPADYLNAGAFLAWILIVNSCLQCGAMVGYVWMTAALLRHDLELQASTDPLTGLLNRRAIGQMAGRVIASSRHADAQVAAITIDLDGFKQINDTFGHSCGDATLIGVASCLQGELRTNDSLARLGGDEFAVLLPRTTMIEAGEIAERLRGALERLEIPHGQARVRVTASIGLAQAEESLRDWNHLVTQCDQALYGAKKAGGNQVVRLADLA
jgi:diguanylate cyclase (GGDEF)-like protein